VTEQDDETKRVTEYTELLLGETREELTRADSRAHLLFAASGVILGAILAGVINGNWRPGDLDTLATIAFGIGTALYVAAIGGLGYAIWPRVRHEEETRPADYFGDIVNYKGKEKRPALREAVKRGAANPDRATSQLLIVSLIVWKKYAGIRAALILFPLSLACCAGAVIFG